MKKIPSQKAPLIDSHGWPLKVVGDASVGTRGLCGGRFVPVIIVDTSLRPDVDELIRVHPAFQSPGDVRSQWGRIEGRDDLVVLCLTFERPSEIRLLVQFEIVRQGCLVEQALFSKALYIQGGREGDRVKTDINAPKVLIELPEMGFRSVWDELFREHLEKYFRKRKGFDRASSKRAAINAIGEWRKLITLRMTEVAGK